MSRKIHLGQLNSIQIRLHQVSQMSSVQVSPGHRLLNLDQLKSDQVRSD